jgi:surface antigen
MTRTIRPALTGLCALALALPSLPGFAQTATGAPGPGTAPARPAAGVFGCAAGGNQQEIGAVVGGLAGAALGNALSRNNRTIGMVLGGALGAAAGSWIGCRLQISDQQKAQAALERALADNAAQSWRSEIGAASGTVEVVRTDMIQPGTQAVAQPVSARAPAPLPGFAHGVMQLTSYDLAPAGQFVARGRVNVRSGPGTSSPVVSRLAANERVQVLAGVPGQPWYLIGTDSAATGYVSSSLLALARPTPMNTRATASLEPPQPCRTLRETIDGIGDGPQVAMYRGCRNPDGTWTLHSA